MTLSVVGWVTGFTVTLNVRVTVLLLAPPSFTVTLMVTTPFPLTAGVKLNVPLVLGLV